MWWSILISMLVALVKWLIGLDRPLTTKEFTNLSRVYGYCQKVSTYCVAKGVPPVNDPD